MKKGKLIWALTIWFSWAVSKDVETLYRHQTSADFSAYSQIGAPILFYSLASLVLVLNLATVFYLIKPKPVGLKVAYSALLAAALYNIVTFGLGLSNLEKMKDAYVVSRESRGLPVHGDSLAMMFSPMGFAMALLLSLLFYAFIAYLLQTRKRYFNTLAVKAG